MNGLSTLNALCLSSSRRLSDVLLCMLDAKMMGQWKWAHCGYYILIFLLLSFAQPVIVSEFIHIRIPAEHAARLMILADLSGCRMNNYVTREQRHIGLEFWQCLYTDMLSHGLFCHFVKFPHLWMLNIQLELTPPEIWFSASTEHIFIFSNKCENNLMASVKRSY